MLELTRRPALLRERLAAHPGKLAEPVILDEVQKVPARLRRGRQDREGVLPGPARVPGPALGGRGGLSGLVPISRAIPPGGSPPCYANSGAPLGPEFRVNTYTTFVQSVPSVAADPSPRNFVVTWHSNTQDGSAFGVFGQRFGRIVPSNSWTSGWSSSQPPGSTAVTE